MIAGQSTSPKSEPLRLYAPAMLLLLASVLGSASRYDLNQGNVRLGITCAEYGAIGPYFRRITHMTGVIYADYIEPDITPAE
jgi:hypothetical protein